MNMEEEETKAATGAGISEKQIRDYKEIFSLFDKDGDGSITGQELGTVMRALGENPSEAELQRLVIDADIDGNGEIDFAEFIGMMAKQTKGISEEEEIKETFKVFDRTGRGKISAEELREVIINLGERVTDKEIADMMKVADLNGDGYINFNEFERLLSTN